MHVCSRVLCRDTDSVYQETAWGSKEQLQLVPQLTVSELETTCMPVYVTFSVLTAPYVPLQCKKGHLVPEPHCLETVILQMQGTYGSC